MRTAPVAHVRHGNLVHADTGCALIEGPVSESVSAPGALKCICLIMAAYRDSDPKTEAREEIFTTLEQQLLRGTVKPASLFRAISAQQTKVEGEEAEEIAYYSTLIKQARQKVVASYDLQKAKRQLVLTSITEEGGPAELETTLDLLTDALTQLEIGSSAGVSYKGTEIAQWGKEWVNSADYAQARELLISLPVDRKDMSANETLNVRGSWARVADVLEQGARIMMRQLDDASDSIILIKNWTSFSQDSADSAELWTLVSLYDYWIEDDIMALKVPNWAAEHFNKVEKPQQYTKTEMSRVLILTEPPASWEKTVETMLLIWKEAGGSFSFTLNSYGARVHPEDNSDYFKAWESAKAIEG